MLTQKFISKILLAAVAIAPALSGQVNSLSRERLIKYTSQNPYERFPDGRPKVPDALLEKVKEMSAEEVISIGRRATMCGVSHRAAANGRQCRP